MLLHDLRDVDLDERGLLQQISSDPLSLDQGGTPSKLIDGTPLWQIPVPFNPSD